MKFNKSAHKTRPIFQKILIPMSILIVVEILMFTMGIFSGGVTQHLNQNAKDILHERVINRKNDLETMMVNNWSQLDLIVETINDKAEALAASGEISIQHLDDGSDSCTPLLLEIAGDLIATMRQNRVTGAFVIFNNEDLNLSNRRDAYVNKPGIYLRDLDPVSNASFKNMDLLIERAPAAVVRSLGISTDSGWRPQFDFNGYNEGYPDMLYEPFQMAYESSRGTSASRLGGGNAQLNYSDFGYWSQPYLLPDDDRQVISYSVPLILEDGAIYGVVGVDLTLDYLRKVLPYEEIADDKMGSYILCVDKSGDLSFDNVLINGPIYAQFNGNNPKSQLSASSPSNGYSICAGGETFQCSVEYLNLYNTNTPFAYQRWALIGAVRETDLFRFTSRILFTLMAVVALSFLIGVVGSFIASRIVTRPITALSQELDRIEPGSLIQLKPTGILEIDKLSASVENLSRDVIDSSTKLTQIMEMASVKIAGFELKGDEKSVFVTDGFFRVFGLDGIDTKNMDLDRFNHVFMELRKHLQPREEGDPSRLFKIPKGDGYLYVKLTYTVENNRCLGLVEDVTQAIMEKSILEHERDHDLLTGLINRRAFYRSMKRLFHQGEETLKTAALVMMDLDNLKQLNDTYGHDCGDQYIRTTAECFLESVPANTVVSRISGDEFYLFFYGYDNKEEIRALLAALRKSLAAKSIVLPNQEPFHIKISGGIAWYPDDSTSYEELIKFSDFAMYKVKQTMKGQLSDFDVGVYNRESYLLQNKAELEELIRNELVEYYFQPIVDGRTGKIYAFEALMRASMPTLRSPLEIITLAKLEGKLDRIEVLTWFKALEAFSKHRDSGLLPEGCRVFVNSIANQTMPPETRGVFEETFRDYLHLIVLEITEEEQADDRILQEKKQLAKHWNAAIALDDYGSGYNSEKNLLCLAPQFVKVDLSLIQEIHLSPDKQEMLRHIVSYGHERGMRVIAEGIETKEEAETVMRIGVDFMQGYFLARPALVPPPVSDVATECIRSFNKGKMKRGFVPAGLKK